MQATLKSSFNIIKIDMLMNQSTLHFEKKLNYILIFSS